MATITIEHKKIDFCGQFTGLTQETSYNNIDAATIRLTGSDFSFKLRDTRVKRDLSLVKKLSIVFD